LYASYCSLCLFCFNVGETFGFGLVPGA
jgi:hypothetical protein